MDGVLFLGKKAGVTLAVIGGRILETFFAQCLAKITDQIALRAFIDRVPRGQIRIPVGPAIVVLGGHDDILHTHFLKESSPLVRVPILSFEFRNDVLVAKFGRVSTPAFFEVGVIMLGILIDRFWHMFSVAAPAFAITDRAVRAPMNKKANLAVIKPSGNRHFLQ